MIKSMTGFGKVFKSYDDFDITVEIKSVNGKYFDPSFRIPKFLSSLEINLRTLLQETMIRGKIDVRIEIMMKTAVKKPTVNISLLHCYKDILNQIKEECSIRDEIKIEDYLKLPDLIEFQQNEDIEKYMFEKISEAVIECAAQAENMKEKEGAALEDDLKTRLNNMQIILNTIKNSRINVFEYWKDKFIKRLQEIGVSENYEERIIQEASIYGEKADITEEITRLDCHINHFLKIMEKEYPTGKKLDFLSQEMHRELNTIASKSSRNEIINAVIEGKAETDRIREQVQNLV